MIKNETVIVRYCDICGKKIEGYVHSPFVATHYQSVFTDTINDRVQEHAPILDLCGYHSRIVGHLMADIVKDALSFLHNEHKLKEIIKRKEIMSDKRS